MVKIQPNGSWIADASDYGIDMALAYGIAEYLVSNGVKTVLDLGCGNGEYVKVMNRLGLDARGIDGNPKASEFNEFCVTGDLSKPLRTGKFFDAVVSLEVGEHIPKEVELSFLFNLIQSNPKIIVLSWFPYDGEGTGHVNPKTNEEVIRLMAQFDFEHDEVSTEKLRNMATLWWFKTSFLAFKLK